VCLSYTLPPVSWEFSVIKISCIKFQDFHENQTKIRVSRIIRHDKIYWLIGIQDTCNIYGMSYQTWMASTRRSMTLAFHIHLTYSKYCYAQLMCLHVHVFTYVICRFKSWFEILKIFSFTYKNLVFVDTINESINGRGSPKERRE